jgi:hypothetical protein
MGDHRIPFLPAGDYKVRFEIASSTTLEYDVRISTNQPRTLDAVMYPEAVSEEVVVTNEYESVSTGAQGSETMELATSRSSRSAARLAPRSVSQRVLQAPVRTATSRSRARSLASVSTPSTVW